MFNLQNQHKQGRNPSILHSYSPKPSLQSLGIILQSIVNPQHTDGNREMITRKLYIKRNDNEKVVDFRVKINSSRPQNLRL